LLCGSIRARGSNSDGYIFERDRPELVGGHSSSQLHSQWLLGLRQHHQRLHAWQHESHRQRRERHDLRRHRSRGLYYVLLQSGSDRCRGHVCASTQASNTTLAASCSAVPSAPTGVTATATSSSAIGLSWSAVTPPANCSISGYSVYGSTTGGFTPGSTNLLASGLTGTTYANTGLSASTTYYYKVEATDADGTSAASTQQSAETQAASSSVGYVSIDAGGAGVSNANGGDNSFVADEDYSTGGTTYSVTNSITIPTSIAASAAPAPVYQSSRQGAVTYTLPGLVAGTNYIVRLHFAELYFTIAGDGGSRHRIVRRGIPYGPPYDPSKPNDGIKRGLLGLFIGVSIRDQFEFLMSEWMNGSTFAPGIYGTTDPILGNSAEGENTFVIPRENSTPLVISHFPRLVTTRGSAYTFLPSITGLRFIANPPRAFQDNGQTRVVRQLTSENLSTRDSSATIYKCS
jgi:hypothetical protein